MIRLEPIDQVFEVTEWHKTQQLPKIGWPRFMALPRLPKELATIRGKSHLRFQIVGITDHAKTRVNIGLQPGEFKIYRTDV